MKNTLALLTICFLLTACEQATQTNAPTTKTKTSDRIEKNTELMIEEIVIPPNLKDNSLVNNQTAIPKGYIVDTTYLKKPLMVDLNADGKLDAFRVLKNPNKEGMKYLFEFRIANSDKVYFYEDSYGDDLDGFGIFEIASKDEIYVDDEHRFENYTGNIITNDEIDPKYYLKMKADGISVNVLEETCAVSVFFLVDEKIKRIHLC